MNIQGKICWTHSLKSSYYEQRKESKKPEDQTNTCQWVEIETSCIDASCQSVKLCQVASSPENCIKKHSFSQAANG